MSCGENHVNISKNPSRCAQVIIKITNNYTIVSVRSTAKECGVQSTGLHFLAFGGTALKQVEPPCHPLAPSILLGLDDLVDLVQLGIHLLVLSALRAPPVRCLDAELERRARRRLLVVLVSENFTPPHILS